MKPQSAKAKGRRLQQQVVSDLLETFTHLSADDVVSTSMGAGGEDIKLSELARQSIPFSIEAKNQEKLNVWGAIKQAKANAPNATEPVVVMKKNHEDAHVILPWKAFLNLIRPRSDNKDSVDQLQNIAKQISSIASTIH